MSTIAIDARKLLDGGIGTYIRELLSALAAQPGDHEYRALVDRANVGRTPWPPGVTEIPVRAGKYSLDEHWVIPRAARRAGAALLHAPHYTFPLAWGGPSVVTIHDLIHVRWSRFFPPGAGLYARALAGLAVRRARAVIADSSHTRDQIVEYLGIPASGVTVIPLGVSSRMGRRPASAVAAFRARRGLPAEYVLYVGARKAHKNLELLLRAIAMLPARERPPLVLSGAEWEPASSLAALARALGLGESIRFSGPLGDEQDLALLYSGAALYVQPSLDEGFGLPPLEAMACGVPVVSSTGGALPETVGDAAELLDPGDAAAWSGTIAALLADAARRGRLASAGFERARAFTWRQTADRTLAVYAQALE